MTLNPALLRLVAITDSFRDGIDGLTSRAQQAVLGGATMIQLRLPDESPRMLVDIARSLLASLPGVPVVVNSRMDVAMASGAHGVHLSIDDLVPAAARRAAPAGFIIGASVGGDVDVSRTVGADYVAIGPVFGSGGRENSTGAMGLARFSTLCQMCAAPAIAVGGVTAANVASVMATPAIGVAVISALFSSADPMQAARAIRAAQDASGS
ncbi:MAG: thiE [Gemmatimonadetes bacterium]|nr:thiE [Gemmatimonadota bacterium]